MEKIDNGDRLPYGKNIGRSGAPDLSAMQFLRRFKTAVKRQFLDRRLWSVEGNKRWGQSIQSWLSQENTNGYYGDQWGDPERELRPVLEKYLKPYVGLSKNIVEIGPGGGRWTKHLVPCNRLYLVELNDEFFPYLQKRFSEYQYIQFIKTSGFDLIGIPEQSVDFVFSFDTFVHIERHGISEYLSEISRILGSSGVGVIHHADRNKSPRRANMTPKIMRKLLEKLSLTLISQKPVPTDFNHYDEDCITVFRKP